MIYGWYMFDIWLIDGSRAVNNVYILRWWIKQLMMVKKWLQKLVAMEDD